MIRLRTQITLTAALLATTLAPSVGPAAAATNPTVVEPSVTFTGGGWGHGVGMSQYGALGRAEAGQTAEQIINFYYEGTQIAGAAGLALHPDVVVDNVDVLVGTTNCSSFRPAGAVTIAVDGVEIGTTSDPVAISRNGSGGTYWWEVLAGPGSHCNGSASVASDPGAIDLCPGGCVSQAWPAPAWLTISFADGEPLSVSGAWKKGSEPDRAYAHGEILLLPDGRPLPGGGEGQVSTKCGVPTANDFCIVVANMTMQQYLYGLAEVPASWHLEALRSQAIAGRSYAMSQISARDSSSNWFEPFNLWSTTADQYYVGWNRESESCSTCRWIEAVDVTNDMFAAVGDQIASTFYSSSNGGYTSANEDVWGDTPFSYLRAKPDPFDDHPSNPNGERDYGYTFDQISRWLQTYPYADMDVGTVQRIVITDAPPSSRINKALVTIQGSARTIEVRKSSGEPYGFRFWNAIRLGCQADNASGKPCSAPQASRMKISSFFDVPAGQWYSTPIQWVSNANISTGVAPNLFAPFDPNTRSSVAVFLWRFADRPPAVLPGPFADVPAGAYYETAVAWLLAAGVTTGTSPTEFSPTEPVTRGQAATFLWRFAGRPTPTVVQTFTDVDPLRYYATPISWMVEWDITTGTSPTTFEPEKTVSRAEMATFLWRFAGQPDAFAEGTTPPPSMRVP